MGDMKRVPFTSSRLPDVLHIEAPGCIINITKGLHDSSGREVTRVEILADGYIGEEWDIDDGSDSERASLSARVIKREAGEIRIHTHVHPLVQAARDRRR